jgi:hypothetical protein
MSEWFLAHAGPEWLATLTTVGLVLAWRWWTRRDRFPDMPPMSAEWRHDKARHRLDRH